MLVVFITVVVVILGLIALIVGARAPAEKHDLAVVLAHRGYGLLGIGAAIMVGSWLLRRFRDY